jgi:hypothetical protein
MRVRFDEVRLVPVVHAHGLRPAPIQPELDCAKHLDDQAVLSPDTVDRNIQGAIPRDGRGRKEITQLPREVFGGGRVRKLDRDHTVERLGMPKPLLPIRTVSRLDSALWAF